MNRKLRKIEFPSKNEYPKYVEMYMKWVAKEEGLISQLEICAENTLNLIDSLSEYDLNFRYQEDKWSIKEILIHLVDDERIYAYRALCFSRNDNTNLPGFEQDDYIKYADVEERPINNIIEEYKAVRTSTIALFKGFSERALLRKGIANGNKASVRALGYHILGHELHHIQTVKISYLKELNKASH